MNCDLETRRAIFACLGSHLYLQDGKLNIQLRKPFKFIFEGLPQAEQEILRLEPLKTAVNKRQYKVLAQKFPIWSG